VVPGVSKKLSGIKSLGKKLRTENKGPTGSGDKESVGANVAYYFMKIRYEGPV
jgi:hypothetical protein